MQRIPIALHHLPDDVDALKSLLTDELVRNEQLQADKQAANQKSERPTTENQCYRIQVLTLTEQPNLALARRYATSSSDQREESKTENAMLMALQSELRGVQEQLLLNIDLHGRQADSTLKLAIRMQSARDRLIQKTGSEPNKGL